ENYLQPSDSACRWCRAKATCPALTARIEAEIGESFDDLTVQSQIAPSPELDAIALARAMAAVHLVEDWCKAVRAEVERRLVGGQDVPGYKLVQGRRGARAWSQQEEAETHDQLRGNLIIDQGMPAAARAGVPSASCPCLCGGR
ncbi:MAG: DUF2800 domain-containing protein, partial [Alphaproteobacteria bacterium]|nr:DUF2800 domain-containing protein [Alphaproteobacteria bacterium]